MQSTEWLELLGQQKDIINRIQSRLKTCGPYVDCKQGIETLQCAIAVYQTIEYEYLEAKQQETEEKISSSEAMAAAAYLTHYEFIDSPYHPSDPDWEGLSTRIKEGWYKVVEAVLQNRENELSP